MVGYLGMTLTLVTYIATDCFLQFENCLVVKGFFFFLPLTELVYSIFFFKENQNDIIEL